MALARTNLTLPEELLREVDALAGPRGRSRYVADAVAQRLRRDRLGLAIQQAAGISSTRQSRRAVAAQIAALRSEETN